MSESPYQSPDSNVAPKPAGSEEEQDLAAFVGPKNTEYYLERSRRISAGNTVSWHWPAFFITLYWLLYRKMWAYAAAYFAILFLGAPGATALLALAIGPELADLLVSLVLLVVSLVVIPIYANKIYLGYAESKLAAIHAKDLDAETRQLKIASAGGTALWAPLLFLAFFLFIIFAAIGFPAYQDYVVRAQAAEGFALASEPKNAIVRYYEASGDFPPDNAAAGLPAANDLRGKYVSSVTVDGSLIIVNYGDDAHIMLQGRALLVGLDNDALPAYSWLCGSEDIEDRHLPMACRE
ncbi:MAG: pilin [Pseudomonadota bacterium]